MDFIMMYMNYASLPAHYDNHGGGNSCAAYVYVLKVLTPPPPRYITTEFSFYYM